MQHIVEATPSSREEALSERRLVLTVDADGLVTEAEDAPAWLFGFSPQQLVGRSLAGGGEGAVEGGGWRVEASGWAETGHARSKLLRTITPLRQLLAVLCCHCRCRRYRACVATAAAADRWRRHSGSRDRRRYGGAAGGGSADIAGWRGHGGSLRGQRGGGDVHH